MALLTLYFSHVSNNMLVGTITIIIIKLTGGQIRKLNDWSILAYFAFVFNENFKLYHISKPLSKINDLFSINISSIHLRLLVRKDRIL
jgi:hypothetical protein